MKTPTVTTAVCAAALLAATASADARRFTATVAWSGAPVTDVPAALRISETLVDGFDYAAAGDGTHFTITDGTGAVLPYEIDAWNPGGESLLWVKIPYFADGKKITVAYGDTERNMAARAAEVWSNYIGVWHMNDTNALGKIPNAAGDARFDAEVSSSSRIGGAGKFGQSALIFTNAYHGKKNTAAAYEKGGVFIPDGGALDLSGDFAISGWFNHTTAAASAYESGNDSKAFRWDNIFCKRPHPQNDTSSGFGLRIGDNQDDLKKLQLCTESNRMDCNGASNFGTGKWHHFALVFGGSAVTNRIDGAQHGVQNLSSALVDNDGPLVVGNTQNACLDNGGDRAWGGYADEVRLVRGAPSEAWFAAEYAAMTGALVVDSDVCTLNIDRNEFFDDAVAVSSDVPAVAEGKYRRGTTVTLTAVPGATGAFRKWYGDVPRETCTNATVSFTMDEDRWIYARFVHPWTLTLPATGNTGSMTDGNFTVNVTEANRYRYTLTVGKNWDGESGLLVSGDTGSGVVDLGGPITLDGDDTPWTITKFGAYKSTQVVWTNHAGRVHTYISPGTVTTENKSQILHCGDNDPDKGKYPYAASYETIILDEPAITRFFDTYLIANQTNLNTLVFDFPRVTNASVNSHRSFYNIPLANTKFDWWDISSVSSITNTFFAKRWGRYFEMYLRVPCTGTLSLPCIRGVDWIPGDGTQLYLMPGVEAIRLGGKDEATTVTNLCTYAFAGDSSLRELTLHAAPDMTVGKRIFADHTYAESNGREPEVIDGVSYFVGNYNSRGRVPDVIRFTGPAISAEAVANLLDACPVVETAAKPVAIHASRFQPGWGRLDRADWISDPTPAERAAYRGQRLIGVYRAGAEAPAGKAVVVHVENDWDDKIEPTILLLR